MIERSGYNQVGSKETTYKIIWDLSKSLAKELSLPEYIDSEDHIDDVAEYLEDKYGYQVYGLEEV